MERGFTARCGACGHAQELRVGGGEAAPDIWEVLAELPDALRARAESILRSNAEAVLDWDRVLHRCPDCGRRYGLLKAVISLDERNLFRTAYQCSRCRVRLVADEGACDVSGDTVRNWACVRCGEKTVRVSESVLKG